MKTIAIIGKPNVGKSSLFNRLAKQRIAITSEIAGTTRDTKVAQITINDNIVRLIDTGGIESSNDELFVKIAQNAIEAAKSADAVLYVVDGKEIPSLEDKKLFFKISKQTPCLLVVNKIDNDAQKEFGYAFFEFGTQEVYCISVTHNRGISILLNALHKLLFSISNETPQSMEEELLYQLEDMLEPESSQEVLKKAKAESSGLDSSELDSKEIRVGIIGRVNVGKSSLLNALVGKERSITSPTAGTTIDPVDEQITFQDRTILFVDTAGIRRRGKIQSLEKFALDRTNKVLEAADIAILVLDASEPLVQLDERIFSLVEKHMLGVIVVWNKWDIKYADFTTIRNAFAQRFRFLEYAPFLTLSALTGRHIVELKQKILEVYDNYTLHIPTAKLNESIANAIKAHPIASDHGKIVKIYYATQYATKPPQIALISNRPNALHFSYKRFLVNRLRKEFGFSGVPILLKARAKNQGNNQ